MFGKYLDCGATGFLVYAFIILSHCLCHCCSYFSILFLVDSILDSWSLDFWTPFFLLSTFLLFSIFLPIFLLSDLPFQSLFPVFLPFNHS